MSTYKRAGISYRTKPFDVDRLPFMEELLNKPGLAPAVRAMLKSEAGGMDPSAQQKVFGTMINRAAGLGTTLEDTVQRTGRSYYEPYENGAFRRNYRPANSKSGSDFYDPLILAELKDPTTSRSHNASAGVARSAIKGGWDAIPYKLGGGELADKEYLYDKTFNNERNYQRMARTVVPAPERNPDAIADGTGKPVEEVVKTIQADKSGKMLKPLGSSVTPQIAALAKPTTRTITPPTMTLGGPKGILSDDEIKTANIKTAEEVATGVTPVRDEDEVIPAVPNAVAEVNQDINGRVARDESGRVVGLRVPDPQDQISQIEQTYGGIGDRRAELARGLYAGKPLTNWQKAMGALQQVGGVVGVAQGGPGSRWGLGVIGGDSILGSHQDQMSKLESQLREAEYGARDASIVAGGTESAALYKKMREEKAAARQKANSLIRVHSDANGRPTTEGIAAAAAVLRSQGMEEDATNLEKGFAAELAPTEKQEEQIEALYTTGPGVEGPAPGDRLGGLSGVAANIDGALDDSPQARPQLQEDGVYGVGQTVDPAINAREVVTERNRQLRSTGGVAPNANPATLHQNPAMVQAEAQVQVLERQADRANAEGLDGLEKSLRGRAASLKERYGLEDFGKRAGENIADTQFKKPPAKSYAQTAKERLEQAKMAASVEDSFIGFDKMKKDISVLVDLETGKLKPAAQRLFGWSDWAGRDATISPSSDTAEALSAWNNLQKSMSKKGLERLRLAGVAPGPMSEKEWPLMAADIMNFDRGQSGEAAARQIMGAVDLIGRTAKMGKTRFHRAWNERYDDYVSSWDKKEAAAAKAAGEVRPTRATATPERVSKPAVTSAPQRSSAPSTGTHARVWVGTPKMDESGRAAVGSRFTRRVPDKTAEKADLGNDGLIEPKMLTEEYEITGYTSSGKIKYKRVEADKEHYDSEQNLPR